MRSKPKSQLKSRGFQFQSPVDWSATGAHLGVATLITRPSVIMYSSPKCVGDLPYIRNLNTLSHGPKCMARLKSHSLLLSGAIETKLRGNTFSWEFTHQLVCNLMFCGRIIGAVKPPIHLVWKNAVKSKSGLLSLSTKIQGRSPLCQIRHHIRVGWQIWLVWNIPR